MFKNRVFWIYSVIYITCLVYLSRYSSFNSGEAIAAFVLFGLIFPAIAYWLSRSAVPLVDRRDSIRQEVLSLVGLLLFITIYLAVGPEKVNAILHVTKSSPRLYALLTLVQKLVVFVLVPLLVLTRWVGLTSKDFGIQRKIGLWYENGYVRILLGMSLVMLVFQFFAGQAAAPIRQGQFSFGQLAVGLPLTYIWLVLEVGLVEEFFFRAVVQSRLAANLKSDVSAILIASLLFGLAHAPGLILRGGGANSPVGSDPSTLFAVCYSVVVLSAAGLFLGIVWARTRNLFLVVLIHASVDLLPGFSKFVETWGIH